MVRYKNRYLAVELQVKDRPEHAPFELKKSSLYWAVMRKIEQLHGDFGVAAVTNGFVAKYCNPYTKVAVLRCRHGPHRFIATALPLVKDIMNVPVVIKIIYVGATLAKCFKYITRHQRKCLERFWNKMKTDVDRLKMKDALLKISSLDMN